MTENKQVNTEGYSCNFSSTWAETEKNSRLYMAILSNHTLKSDEKLVLSVLYSNLVSEDSIDGLGYYSIHPNRLSFLCSISVEKCAEIIALFLRRGYITEHEKELTCDCPCDYQGGKFIRYETNYKIFDDYSHTYLINSPAKLHSDHEKNIPCKFGVNFNG